MSEPVKEVSGVELPEEILNEILSKRIIIVGNPQTGKSNAAMWIIRQFRRKYQNVRNLVFDTTLRWRLNFDSMPYIELSDLASSLPDVKDMLYDVQLFDPSEVKTAIGQLLLEDYQLRRVIKANTGALPYYSLYTIEEAQNVIGTTALRDASGKFWLKVISECGNFDMSMIFIGQRLADISPSVVERSHTYLFGPSYGDNDVRKIKNLTNKLIVEKIKMLDRSEFILWTGRSGYFLRFPKFEQVGKPEAYYKETNGFVFRKIFGR